jgi:L,D-transpeptidase catalytic domain
VFENQSLMNYGYQFGMSEIKGNMPGQGPTAISVPKNAASWVRVGLITLTFCGLLVEPRHAQAISGTNFRVALRHTQSGVGRKIPLPGPEVVKKDPLSKAPKGPVQIIISVAKQRLSIYDNGALIARSSVSTGMPGHRTPLGIFSVISKQRWHRSNIYSDAPMPYMQRITWSGIALHAGVLPGYAASHGCIRLANGFAIRLWHLTKRGTRVIIARDEVAPVEIAHAQLFRPKARVALPEIPEDASISRDLVKTAAAEVGAMATATPAADSLSARSAPAVAATATPITVLVSRKEGKLFVRQRSTPVLEAPISIQNPEQPLGTHVFTAMELETGGAAMRWTVVSMGAEPARKPIGSGHDANHFSRQAARTQVLQAAAELPAKPTATAALERIKISTDLDARISELLTPGSSFIIADAGVSEETGSDTDLIVLTH